MPKDKDHTKSCPSSTCHEGAVLLGKVKSDGTVAFMSNKMELDGESVKEFQKLGDPELYYRFSSGCIQSGCNQWNNTTGRCTVIEKVLAVEIDFPLDETLPKCVIRKDCRWFFQEGAAACRICPLVVTNMTSPV